MGKKSSPAAPAAPDPVATANAQAQANTTAAVTQANLNRIDQYTPQGSLTYSVVGNNPDGTPRYAQTQSYSPDQQKLYDQQNQIAQALGGLAGNNISRVAEAQSTPFSYAGMTPLQSGVSRGALATGLVNPQATTQVGNAGPIASGYNNGGGIQSTFNTGGPLTSNVSQPGVQSSLDLGGNFNPGSFNATAKTAADSAYAAAASRLDPQFAQQEGDMRARLANSGITENSDAFRREMDNFSRNRTDAYGQAQANAFGQGLAAQQQGFSQALGTRQQNVSDATTAGTFANNAAGQIFGMGVTNANLNNAAQGQQYGQNMGAAQFGNAAQGQANQQNLQAATFGNSAQDQRYNQNLSNAGFYNSAQGQNFQQGQQAAAFANTTQNQDFNQQLAGAQFANQARQQQIQESAYLRNLPLNDIATLLGTGGGVQGPQFNNFAQVGVAAPDYMGAVYQNYNAANQQYQQAQQARSQGLGSIFGLAGTLGAARISDRRLKTNVRRIGTLASGLATYVYNYLGSSRPEFGVMAQEVASVRPEAVITLPGGYMAVDYSKVWNG